MSSFNWNSIFGRFSSSSSATDGQHNNNEAAIVVASPTTMARSSRRNSASASGNNRNQDGSDRHDRSGRSQSRPHSLHGVDATRRRGSLVSPIMSSPRSADIEARITVDPNITIPITRRTGTLPSRNNRNDNSAGGLTEPMSDEYQFPPELPARIRFVPYNPYFPTFDKELSNGAVVCIGRYQRNHPSEDPNHDGIYFRSTVVSRKHAQLLFINGEFFLKDTQSLGGTFINSTRLSAAGKESAMYKIFHGDVIQFGIDYRPDLQTGQVRPKDRCVEVLVEFPALIKRKKRSQRPMKWEPAKHKHTECCICISALYVKQALFIAPCAHSFHYRCIAPLLNKGRGFVCPMCRQENDLQESVWSLDEDYSEGGAREIPAELYQDDDDEEMDDNVARSEGIGGGQVVNDFAGNQLLVPNAPADTRGGSEEGSNEELAAQSPRESRRDSTIEHVAANLRNMASLPEDHPTNN